MSISVTDTGIGLTEDHISRALEPFGQIENALNRRHDGTGLGLPLVKALIESHGGRLEIDSTPKKGTRMHLIFPTDRLLPETDSESEEDEKEARVVPARPKKARARKR